MAPPTPRPAPEAALPTRVKQALIRALMLNDRGPDDIADDAPLFEEEGLNLDSVDAIELAVELEREFGVRMPDGPESRPIYASIATVCAFLRERGAA